MLSVENTTNQRRRSLTFADKFEVKFFFKAEAPREVAFSETSFTTGSESYYDDDDDWDQEDSYDEEEYYDEQQEYEDYYDYDNNQDIYFDQSQSYQRSYRSYIPSEYDNYNSYDGNYYESDMNFSILYGMGPSNESRAVVEYDESQESKIRNHHHRELFAVFKDEDENNTQKTSERTNTRRLALAKLEKGLFRRQQLRDSESEESEASSSNSESDSFDEPLSESSDDFFNELKQNNSPVTLKATFTSEIPGTVPISNHNSKESEDDALLTPLENNKSTISSTSNSDCVKDLLKTTSLSNTSPPSSPIDVKYVNSLNNNDLVKTISSNSNTLLSNNKTLNKNTTINTLLINIPNKSVNNKGVKKKIISYSSPTIQQLLPCY